MIESAYLWLSTFSGAKYSGWVICMDELYSTVLSLGAGKHTESFQKEIETGTHGISQQWQWQQNRRNLIPCARNLNTHPSDQFLKAAVRDQEPESMQVTLTWKSPKGRAPGLLEVRVLPWSIHGHDCDKMCEFWGHRWRSPPAEVRDMNRISQMLMAEPWASSLGFHNSGESWRICFYFQGNSR